MIDITGNHFTSQSTTWHGTSRRFMADMHDVSSEFARLGIQALMTKVLRCWLAIGSDPLRQFWLDEKMLRPALIHLKNFT